MSRNYNAEGRDARSKNQARGSCRYKREDIAAQWVAGWDARDAEIAESARKAARPRWTQGRPFAGFDSQQLRGDAPPIHIGSHVDDPSMIFVSCPAWGIDRYPLAKVGGGLSVVAVQALAMVRVRQIMTERLALIDKIAGSDGQLRAEE